MNSIGEAQKISRLIKAVTELRQALGDLDGWHGQEELQILAEIDSMLNQRAHARAQIYLRQPQSDQEAGGAQPTQSA